MDSYQLIFFWAGKAKWETEEGFVLHPDDYDTFPNSKDIFFIQGE